jgi:NAD-dependent dihydropyrimidine dehydrogenase PreA subunit
MKVLKVGKVKKVSEVSHPKREYRFISQTIGFEKSAKKNHIEMKNTPYKIELPPKFMVKRYNNCTNVQECIQVCIYGVHITNEDGQMAEPIEDLCRGCYLCVLACPKNAISIGINPEFEKLGNSYFTPERIKTIYSEAETGRVPVSGTGYGGPFAENGFDSIWVDFSEIVRPTRDGIHGREYISTSVDLGRKLSNLRFDGNRKLLSNVPHTIEIPIPMILDAPLHCRTGKNLMLALAMAATKLNIFAVVDAKEYGNDLLSFRLNLIPRISSDEIDEYEELIEISPIVEINILGQKIKNYINKVKTINPSVLISLRFSYDEESCERAETFTKMGADILHVHVDDEIVERDPDIALNAIHSVHSHLVDKCIRDEITLIFSGGIAEAAHVPKSIILGADTVLLGLAFQIALGCTGCYGNEHASNCPMEVEDEDIGAAAQRIINLTGSWKDQLLEILGGMGLKEVRRQRGEIGRAIFYRELEERIFGDNE